MLTGSFGPQDLLAVVILVGMACNGGVRAWKWLKDRSKQDTEG